MENFLFLLLFPFVWFIFAKHKWNMTISYPEMFIGIGVISTIVVSLYAGGMYMNMSDTEIWNGEILSKKRVHDEYERSYDCMCVTVSCGKDCTTQSCQTCYEDHYTVSWDAKSTIGGFNFGYKDSTSSSVYMSPDPALYTKCKVGDPASTERSYTNYVGALPDSLFNTSMENDVYASKIPTYPRVNSIYQINRVIDKVGLGVKAKELDKALDEELKTLGKTHQVNIIVILTDVLDPMYRHSVENAWVGGKKNDVVVFFGIDKKTKEIQWSDVMTWALNSGNEIFNVTLKDELAEFKTIEPLAITSVITKNIVTLYDRPHMSDYEYLKDDISPPDWLLGIAYFISIFGTLGFSYFLHRKQVA